MLINGPYNIMSYIVRQVVVCTAEGHQSGLRILPLVSRILLERLQDLSLAVGHLSGCQALSALQHHRFAADGKKAWSLHTLDLGGTAVRDVSALAGCCEPAHARPPWHTGERCVSTGRLLEPAHAQPPQHSRVTDVSALAGCLSLHTLNLRNTRVTDRVSAGELLEPAHTRPQQHMGDGCVSAGGLLEPAHT